MTATQTADQINAAIKAGKTVTVNGRKAVSSFGQDPAHVWTNGTLSVDVEPRTRGARVGTVYVKAGQTVNVEIA